MDNIPEDASATEKGAEKTMNAFPTAIPPFPHFHGLLFEDRIPTTAKIMAKINATRGL